MAKTKKSEGKTPVKNHFVFSKDNYTWMLIGLAVIVLGFVLMYGKTTLAPIVVLSGFMIEIYAIMKKPKAQK
jgi:hypothetical protein